MAVGPVMTISVFFNGQLSDNASFGILNKGADILHLLGVGELFAGHSHAVFQYTLGIDDAIGLMDGIDRLSGKSSAAKTDEVHACIAHRFLSGNNVGWNILTGARAALEHDVTTHPTELVEQAGGRDNGVVINLHLTGKLCGIADDTAIADHTVVGHVHVLHQQVPATDNRLAFGSRTTTDGHILADGVVVTNLTGGFLTLELQILRLRGDAGTRKELVVTADTGTIMNGYVVEELIIVTNDHVLVNDTEGANYIAITEFSLGIDNC